MYSRRSYDDLIPGALDRYAASVQVGKGQVNAKGEKQAGGEGVTVTGMIWWPEKNQRQQKIEEGEGNGEHTRN